MYLNRLKELKKIYRSNSLDEILIDIQLDDYRDVYCEWDYSPYKNRDLDDDFVEFLLECSYEIGLRYTMKVVFHLPKVIQSENREVKSTEGIHHFFGYQFKRNRNCMVRLIRDTIFFFLLGTFLITVSTIMENTLTANLLKQVLIEGLYIGGWVMLWEMFSTWFFEVKKYQKKLKHYRRLQLVEYEYYYGDQDV